MVLPLVRVADGADARWNVPCGDSHTCLCVLDSATTLHAFLKQSVTQAIGRPLLHKKSSDAQLLRIIKQAETCKICASKKK